MMFHQCLVVSTLGRVILLGPEKQVCNAGTSGTLVLNILNWVQLLFLEPLEWRTRHYIVVKVSNSLNDIFWFAKNLDNWCPIVFSFIAELVEVCKPDQACLDKLRRRPRCLKFSEISNLKTWSVDESLPGFIQLILLWWVKLLLLFVKVCNTDDLGFLISLNTSLRFHIFFDFG